MVLPGHDSLQSFTHCVFQSTNGCRPKSTLVHDIMTLTAVHFKRSTEMKGNNQKDSKSG